MAVAGYEFRCLPFGIVSAPRDFTRLVKPIVGLLRRLGVRLVIYLDDVILLNQDYQRLLREARTLEVLLESLGFLVNMKKSVLVPVKWSGFSGLERFRQQGVTNGLSEQAADLLTQSWRLGTKSAYNSSWEKWSCWCKQRSLDPFSATVEEVLNFLTELHLQGYAYRTINGYRSAVSAWHEGIGGVPIGQHMFCD